MQGSSRAQPSGAGAPRLGARRRCALSVLAWIALAAEPAPAAPPAASNGRPSILLVTLDTTRADRLGAYGYARETSPELDRLAAESVVHTRAYSTSSWTLPAHASLFTGKFPTSHGAQLDPTGSLVLGSAVAGPGFLRDFRARPLGPDQRTLAEILSEAGYATAAIVAGPWLKRVFGLDRGFAHYDDEEIHHISGRLAAQVSDAAIAWIDAEPRRPFFLFLNYFDPHGPYTDPEGMARLFAPPDTILYPLPKEPPPEIRDAVYDGEIRYMDRHFGRLLAHLKQRGLYDGSWVVVTADHGELLGEHGAHGHGYSLFEKEIHVPLIVKHPGGVARGRSDRPIQLTDVLPMLLGALGLPAPPGIPPAAPASTRVLAEVYPLGTARSGWRAYIRDDVKLLWNTQGHHALYDLGADPGETRDLAAAQRERVEALSAELERWIGALPRPDGDGPTRQLDEETRRALEGLGYLE